MKIKLLRPEGLAPERSSEHAAGYDLRAAIHSNAEVHVLGGEVVKIPTGFAIEIPIGHVGLIFPRSGLGTRGLVLANATGVIDSDYRGEVMVALHNRNIFEGDEDFTIKHGDKIAQLVIVPCRQDPIQVVEHLSETIRGEGGFGSTGN